MRFPKIPPDINKAIAGLGIPEIIKLHENMRESAVQLDYAHWDELRIYHPPMDVTYEQWWAAIKLYRAPSLSPIGLKDKSGMVFKYSVPEAVQDQLHKIDFTAGGKVSSPGQISGIPVKERYLISSLVEEAITSSQLEGAATTREIAKEMIQSGRLPRDKSERMILNNYQTMLQIREFKDQSLTPEIVLKIHKLITEETLENPDDAGRIRSADREIEVRNLEGDVFHAPPLAHELDDRIKRMCEFANQESSKSFIHPVIRAIILHFWLAYDHPFVDGNGRTARALFYWSLLRDGYWLFEYISISRILKNAPAQYAKSFLYTETDGNDLTYFLIAQAKVIERAVRELHEYLDRKEEEYQEAESKMRALELFNHRQASLIRHALKHLDQKYSFEWYSKWHQIVYQTARTDLLDLKKRGIFKVTKRGKKNLFYPRKDLADYLLSLPLEVS